MSKQLMRPGASNERGQTLVMVAIMLMVLLALGAMSLDVAEVLWSRGTQQNAADAAALAGVRALPDDPDTAVDIARTYAESNGFDADSDPRVQVTAIPTQVTLPDGTHLPALDVTVQRTVPPGLRSAVGGGDIVVPARAIAVVTSVVNMCKVLPMAIRNSVQPYDRNGNPIGSPRAYDDTYGYLVKLKMSPGNAYSGGNFGSLALAGGSGGNDYRDYIAAGGGCVESEDIPTETGAMTGPTEQGFASLIEQAVGPIGSRPACGSLYPDGVNRVECTLGVPDNVHWDTVTDGDPWDKPWGLGSPNQAVDSKCSGPPTGGEPHPSVVVGPCTRVLTVPVVDGSWDNGSTIIHVDHWASFYVIGTEGSGSNMVVVGSFINYAVSPVGLADWGDPTDASQIGYFLWR